MNSTTVRFAPLAAVMLITALAVPTTVSARELTIDGSLETVDMQTIIPPNMYVELEGVGCASHLGRFHLEAEAVVFLPTRAGEGVFQIDAGGGAKLLGTTAGQGTPIPDTDLSRVEEVLTITSGTGRFKGATGTLYMHRIVNRVTKVGTGTIDGTIVLPDPGRRCRRR